ncbi:MAG: hypothetical protein ACKVKL_13920 [Pseudomonadales bacterium]
MANLNWCLSLICFFVLASIATPLFAKSWQHYGADGARGHSTSGTTLCDYVVSFALPD